MKEPTIFISYSNLDSKIADELDVCLQAAGLTAKRDVRDVTYKDNFKIFMKEIRRADFVICIISDNFLRSTNCMFEVLKFRKEEN